MTLALMTLPPMSLPPMSLPAVLLLADSRLPTGGHAHSGGVEMAVEAGLVSTVDDLVAWLRGRLRTAAPVLASFSAAAALGPDDWRCWDRALSARIPSAAQRAASRAQGAALLRTATRMWSLPAGLVELGRPHQPLVLGAATRAGGADAGDAAALAVHHLLGGACSAAVRLLGLDPLTVAAAQAGLTESAARVAAEAVAVARAAVAEANPDLMPAVSGPMTELLAAAHAHQEVTLFAS